MHMFLEPYLSKFLSIKALPGPPPLTEEQAIRWLLDEMYLASREMVRTHHKEDIIRFIVLAQTLEAHGYTIMWLKHQHVVGARRKNADTGNSQESHRTA